MTRTEIVCILVMCGAMLAGLGIFLYEVHAGRESRELARQHRDACAEQGLPATECCRVGQAWVCPLTMKESNDE